MKRLLYILPVIAFVLAGCEDVSERDCGSFNHPELALWQSDTGEGIVTYMNSEGERIVFNKTSVMLNEPFLGTDGSSNDEDVLCRLTATVRMQADDNSLAITTTYTQLEQSQLAPEEEALLIDHVLESPVPTVLAGNFPADISVDRVRINANPTRVRYLDEGQTAEFNGQAFEDVIRIFAPGVTPPEPETQDTDAGVDVDANVDIVTDAEAEPEPEPNDPPINASDAIKQLVLARNVGLIAFTDTQDREFIQVPSN